MDRIQKKLERRTTMLGQVAMVVQIRSLHRRPVSLRLPWMIRRSIKNTLCGKKPLEIPVDA
jgi:hypothetical protein